GEELARAAGVDGFGERRRLREVWSRSLEPEQIGIGRVREATRDRGRDSVPDAVEALARPLARQELLISFVDVAREELRGESVGARDEDRRHLENVGGEPRGRQRPDEVARGDEHLAA